MNNTQPAGAYGFKITAPGVKTWVDVNGNPVTSGASQSTPVQSGSQTTTFYSPKNNTQSPSQSSVMGGNTDTSPVIGNPALNNTLPVGSQPTQPTQTNLPVGYPSFTQTAQGAQGSPIDTSAATRAKYQSIALNSPRSGVPQTSAEGMSAVSDAQAFYQASNPPQTPLSPEANDAVGAVMTDLQSAIADQNSLIPETVQQYVASNSGGIAAMQADVLNTQTLINGTVDDIRAEVSASGGFATESQIQGMAATRNQALVKHLTNVQNQLSIAQSNLSLNTSAFQADQAAAKESLSTRISNDENLLGLYKNVQTQSMDMYKNLANTIGYQQLAKNLYLQDPSGASARAASAVLGLDLTNPNVVADAETYREKTLALSAARFQYQQGNLPNDPLGVPGAENVTPSDKANAPVSQLTDDPNKIVPYTNGMTLGAVRNAAATYLYTGKLANVTIGRTGKAAILNEADAMAQRMGLSPEDLVVMQTSYKADLSSLAKLQTQADSAQASEQKTLKNLNVAMSYASKVPRTGSPFANRYDLWTKGQLKGDPNTVAFETAIYTAANEYAKVVSGSTGGAGSTDTARKEAGDVLNAFYNNEQLDAISGVMKQDMANTISSYTDQISAIKQRTIGQGSSSDTTNTNDPAGLGI